LSTRDDGLDGLFDGEAVCEAAEATLGSLAEELVLDGRHEVVDGGTTLEGPDADVALVDLPTHGREHALLGFVGEDCFVRVSHFA